MFFYVILRRETGKYISDLPGDDTDLLSWAKRYHSRVDALSEAGPNTCVCGPYSTDEYGERDD